MPLFEEEALRLLQMIYLNIRELTQRTEGLAQKFEKLEQALAAAQVTPTFHPSQLFPTTPARWEDLLYQLFGAELSDTERKVCAYRCTDAGYSDSQIASKLFISKSTVKYHDGKILEKFGLENVRQIQPFVFRKLWERYRRN